MTNERTASLGGWILRDALMTSAIIGGLWGLHLWQSESGSWLPSILAPVFGFIGAYVLCYIFHEWGHLIGARLSGAEMPLQPYAGALIGLFDVSRHSRRQFLWLSWGGVIGYLLVMIATLGVYQMGGLGLAGAGFAIGGLAFVVQSLSVDMPQIQRITRGAEVAATNAAGAHPKVILRRTWQSWSLLAIVLVGFNLLG
jgi:hypothetical protein